MVSIAALGVRDPRVWTTLVGLAVVAALSVWYVAIQHLWLMQVPGVKRWQAWAWAVATFGAATGLVTAANLLAA